MQLRPYQREAVDAIPSYFESNGGNPPEIAKILQIPNTAQVARAWSGKTYRRVA